MTSANIVFTGKQQADVRCEEAPAVYAGLLNDRAGTLDVLFDWRESMMTTSWV